MQSRQPGYYSVFLRKKFVALSCVTLLLALLLTVIPERGVQPGDALLPAPRSGGDHGLQELLVTGELAGPAQVLLAVERHQFEQALPSASEPVSLDANTPEASQSPDIILQWLRNYRTGLTPRQKGDLATVLYQQSVEHGFDPALVMALIATESSFFNWSRSNQGAIGLMQLRPVTAEFMASQPSPSGSQLRWDGEEMLFDPTVNLKLGVRYLSRLRYRFGDISTALTAYNYGPTKVSDWLARCEALPLAYADRVLDLTEKFTGQVRVASGPQPISG